VILVKSGLCIGIFSAGIAIHRLREKTLCCSSLIQTLLIEIVKAGKERRRAMILLP
jgi:hypothetical protein